MIAEMLGMSSRTLQRKLDEEGTRYKDLLNELRLELALYYLKIPIYHSTQLPTSWVTQRRVLFIAVSSSGRVALRALIEPGLLLRLRHPSFAGFFCGAPYANKIATPNFDDVVFGIAAFEQLDGNI